MNKIEVDYSEVQPIPATVEASDWETPVHKYFGRKLPNGKTEKEPVYSHQEYPRFMYSMKNGKVSAKIVRSDAERDSLGEGWEKTPAAFGYIGAPSFEEAIQMKDAQFKPQETAEEVARKPGRPAKA